MRKNITVETCMWKSKGAHLMVARREGGRERERERQRDRETERQRKTDRERERAKSQKSPIRHSQ
jgi:hypothetical protein